MQFLGAKLEYDPKIDYKLGNQWEGVDYQGPFTIEVSKKEKWFQDYSKVFLIL